MQTTALIHEAYLRLVDVKQVRWQNRAHFFAVGGPVDAADSGRLARERGSRKRGGGARQVSLDEALLISAPRNEGLVALDEALSALAEVDARKSRVVELRFFGGMNVEETAEVLKVSVETVNRDWRLAKSWLSRG